MISEEDFNWSTFLHSDFYMMSTSSSHHHPHRHHHHQQTVVGRFSRCEDLYEQTSVRWDTGTLWSCTQDVLSPSYCSGGWSQCRLLIIDLDSLLLSGGTEPSLVQDVTGTRKGIPRSFGSATSFLCFVPFDVPPLGVW
ncbi:unnamed protein product [Ophioblennius macclurei]